MLTDCAKAYSCSTNWAGFVVTSNLTAGDAAGMAQLGLTMRDMQRDAYWQLPIATSVADVETAGALANVGVALPAVELPLTVRRGPIMVTAWKRATLAMGTLMLVTLNKFDSLP